MTDDTTFHSADSRFPRTCHSALAVLRDGAAPERNRAMQVVAQAYWKPVYKYLRLKFRMSKEAAADTTQSFFLAVIEKGFFAPYDPDRARFRTFLRTCLDRFVMNQEKKESRQKRGGDTVLLSLDFDSAEYEIQQAGMSPESSPDRIFEIEWVRSLLSIAVDRLSEICEQSGKKTHYLLFCEYDLGREESAEPITYAALAAKHGLTTEAVTSYLASARREFRRIVLEAIRDMTATDEEYREEVRTVLGIDPS